MAGGDPRQSAARLVAGMALRRTGSIARKRLDKRLADSGITTKDLERVVRRQTGFGTNLAAAALIRLATRSVPGALVVGGGLVAKALLERRRRKAGGEPPA